MQALSAVAMFFQDDMSLAHDVHSLMIAEWIIAVCILLVILALAVAAIVIMGIVRSVEKKVDNVTKTVQSKAMPLIGQGQDLLTKVGEIVADLKPKIASVSNDVQHMSGVVKEKVDEIGLVVSKVSVQVGDTVTKVTAEVSETVTKVNGTVQDVNGKTQAQVARVNGMVSEALTTTEHVSRSIQHGIRVPVTMVAGWVAAAKAGVETLAARTPFLHGMMPKPTGASKARTSGNAEPGGPPFVPAPDAPRRTY